MSSEEEPKKIFMGRFRFDKARKLYIKEVHIESIGILRVYVLQETWYKNIAGNISKALRRLSRENYSTFLFRWGKLEIFNPSTKEWESLQTTKLLRNETEDEDTSSLESETNERILETTEPEPPISQIKARRLARRDAVRKTLFENMAKPHLSPLGRKKDFESKEDEDEEEEEEEEEDEDEDEEEDEDEGSSLMKMASMIPSTPKNKNGTSTELAVSVRTSPEETKKIFNQMSNMKEYTCGFCGILFKSRSGKYKHEKSCEKKDHGLVARPIETTIQASPPESTTTTINGNQVINNNQNIYIQNNIQIRDFGKENPAWLTTKILDQVMNNFSTAIPRLMEKKHFNDDFPENKNLRVCNTKFMNKRLQVYENGRWRMRDSKHTFYQVLVDIYEILSEALADPKEEDMSCTEEIRKARRSQRFIQKVEKIRPIWEGFEAKLTGNDPETQEMLWEDLKTLLLDRKLAIEQGCD
jgi:hypothetical protein